MKRSLQLLGWVLAGLATVAGLCWVLSRALGSAEVLYEGQTLDHWREQATQTDPGLSNRAVAVLVGVIVPRLTNQIFCDTNDSRLRLAVIEQLDNLPGIQVDFTPADGRRSQAIADLRTLGTRAQPAIPALLETLRLHDPILTGPAAKVLADIGTDATTAVPALMACLTDAEGNGNPDVVEALAEYGPKAREAVPVLVRLLADRSSKEIVQVVPKALKAIDPQAAAGAGVK